MRLLVALLALLAAIGLAMRADERLLPGSGEITGRARVVDGDTMEVGGAKLRLSGIDAPESRQTCEAGGETYRCGQRATLALQELLRDRTVHCTRHGRDRYRRILAQCWVGETDVNAWMVERGWAIAYRRHARDYRAQEERAKAARRGIWAGTFEAPEAYRAREREVHHRLASPALASLAPLRALAKEVAAHGGPAGRGPLRPRPPAQVRPPDDLDVVAARGSRG